MQLLPWEKIDTVLLDMDGTLLMPDHRLGEQTVFVSHGDCPQDCAYVVEQLKKRFGVKNVFTNPIGPVIGTHSGPGTVALFFLAENRD